MSRGRHAKPITFHKPLIRSFLIILVALAMLALPAAFAGVDDVDNIADVIHPNIHQNVTNGNNANPNGANDGGGNLHGIANNPGKSGDKPNDDGVKGFANELNTVHGGIGEVNPNAGN